MSTENTPAQTPAPVANELPNGQAAPAVEDGVAAPEGEQPQADPNAAPAETPEHRKASYRFSELSKQLRDAERKAEYYRVLADAAARGGQNAQPPPPAEPQANADPEPSPADYQGKEYDPAYLRDVAKWEGRRAVKAEAEAARKQAAEAQAFETGRARFIEAHADAQAIEQQFPEYAGMANSALDNIARAEAVGAPGRMIDLVTQAENRAWVALALETKPALRQQIWAMDAASRALAIGRLDAQISANLRSAQSTQPAPQPPATPAVSPTPAASAPATLNGRGATPNFNPATASVHDYAEARKSGRFQ